MVELDVCVPMYKPRSRDVRLMLASVSDLATKLDIHLFITVDGELDFDVDELFAEAGFPATAVVRNSRRLGLVGNWRKAVGLGTSPFFLLLHQDDQATAEGVAAQVSMLERYVSVGLVGGHRRVVSLGDRPAHVRVNDRRYVFVHDPEYVVDPLTAARLMGRNGNVFGEPSATVVRRSAYDEVGGYDSRFSHAADLAFALDIANAGWSLGFVNQEVSIRQRHGESATTANLESGVAHRERRVICAAALSKARATDRDDISAALWSLVIHDAISAVRVGAWGRARSTAHEVAALPRPSLGAVLRRLIELIRRRNQDER